MASIVDVDTHIVESAGMWELLDKEMYPRRPLLVSVPDDTVYGNLNAFWLIDGNIFPKPAGKGGFTLNSPSASKRESGRTDIPISCREITDPDARLADMDRLGVETQVIYPTLFLVYLTDDVRLEVALCRAYNQWMAKVWSKSRNRLRWVVVPPLKSIEASIEEIRRAKGNGGVGVFFRGIEGNLTLDNPHFFPIYEEASKLDLPICVHSGPGAPSLMGIFDLERNTVFPHSDLPVMIAFRDIVANKIPEMFPTLRFGFIEACAGWVPHLFYMLMRPFIREIFTPAERWRYSSSVDLFRNNRLFISCEVGEDIPNILRYVGEDNLLIGSDYGHTDPSVVSRLVSTMRSREDLPSHVTEKMLCENPRRFYSL